MLSIDYNTPICLPELIQQSEPAGTQASHNRVFFYSSFTDASHEADFCDSPLPVEDNYLYLNHEHSTRISSKSYYDSGY